MFSVIYTFDVKEGAEQDFIYGWEALTNLFLEHANSLGSRLHRDESGLYVAYAQWPDRAHWENAAELLPPEAEDHSRMMKDSCKAIETRYCLETVSDLLVHP